MRMAPDLRADICSFCARQARQCEPTRLELLDGCLRGAITPTAAARVCEQKCAFAVGCWEGHGIRKAAWPGGSAAREPSGSERFLRKVVPLRESRPDPQREAESRMGLKRGAYVRLAFMPISRSAASMAASASTSCSTVNFRCLRSNERSRTPVSFPRRPRICASSLLQSMLSIW